MYRPINDFTKVRFVMVFSIEGATYIYRLIDDFTKVEFVEVF